MSRESSGDVESGFNTDSALPKISIEWQMPYLKFNEKFYKEVTAFSDHVLILALRVIGEKFTPKVFHFSKFLDKVTNSVDVTSLIKDLQTAGVKLDAHFEAWAERLYSDDSDDESGQVTDVCALISSLKN